MGGDRSVVEDRLSSIHDRGQDRKAIRASGLLLNAVFWIGSEVADQVEVSVSKVSA
jgi:hypothetical protein